jgi:hypothetical protein
MADGWPGWPSIAIVIEHVHPKEKYLRQTQKKVCGHIKSLWATAFIWS